jgi:ribonuclease Z
MTLSATMLGTGYAMATRCYNTCFVLTEDGEGASGTDGAHAGANCAVPDAPSANAENTGAHDATSDAPAAHDEHAARNKHAVNRRAPRRLLVDGGGGNGILNQLERADIDIASIGQIFVTHKHMDHLLGMLWVVRAITHRMAFDSGRDSAGIANGGPRNSAGNDVPRRTSLQTQAHTDNDALTATKPVVTLYAHGEVLQLLQELCDQMLVERQRRYLGTRLRMVELHDGDTYDVVGHPTTFFDMQSPKARQFGFSMELGGIATSGTAMDYADGDASSGANNGTGAASTRPRRLVCLGDEPCRPTAEPYVRDADWLMLEAFCLEKDAERFRPAKKGHSTAIQAAQTAERLGVRNLVLYHTEDTDLAHRQERYTAEARRAFSGRILVPNDLDMFDIR